MNRHQIIVDRIVNDLAVCEIDGAIKDIPLSLINGSAHEGDKLFYDEGSAQYMIDRTGTDERRNQITERFNKLKNRNN